MKNSTSGHKKKWIATIVMLCAIASGCRFYFQRTTDQFTIDKHTGSIGNGKNLAENICSGCHYDEGTKKYTGILLSDLPAIGGKLYSANLTHSKKYGVTDRYSDAELFYLLKTGISKNGKFMPYMMRPTMADQDVKDIILYFRSDDEPLRAGDTIAGKTRINIIGKAGIRAASKPSPYLKNVPLPDRNDAIAYGRYLTGIIGCYHCHSRSIAGIDYIDPEKSKGYLRGGMKVKDFDGRKVRAANLTPDDETGIGKYTGKQFGRAVREGIGPHTDTLSTAMPRFASLTDKQAHAIFTYLKQLKPIHHPVH